MFVRVKKTGPYQYLQIVENNREGNKVKQRIIGTLGRVDHLKNTSQIESLIHKLSRFTNQATLVLNGFSQANAHTISIGPALIFERIWKDLGLDEIISELAKTTKHEF
ncbi:MAG: transposase, partial [Bacteroidetes bacterium]|nr:transposase [Bacteroidota bacterium]